MDTPHEDALHEEVVANANKLGIKEAPPNLVGNQNEVQPNLEKNDCNPTNINMCHRQWTNRWCRSAKNLANMFIEYEVPRLVGEARMDLIQPSDAKFGSFSTLGFYSEEAKVGYSLEHEDSMETQLVEIIHTSTKKARE